MADPKAATALLQLLDIMSTLRSPQGCPWDAEQTPESLRPYLVEETYEVLQALDSGAPEEIRDELGDLLLQIVFQARIFEERGLFDMAEVAEAISQKLIRRHPHVFDTPTDCSPEMLDRQWEQIKRTEKKERRGKSTLLGDIPSALPALLRARKVTEKASRVGFDWKRPEDVLAKIREELAELEEAIAEGGTRQIEDELGDTLFSVVNLARMLRIDAEEALRGTTERFIRRFNHIEDSIHSRGQNIEDATLQEMDELWEEAKRQEEGRDD